MASNTKQVVKKFIAKQRKECPVCLDDKDVDLKLFQCQHYACTSCVGQSVEVNNFLRISISCGYIEQPPLPI